MAAPKITVDENPDPKLRDEIIKPLRAFNESQVGPIRPEPLAIGLWGHSVAGWLYVDLLVVPDGFRGRGLGTALLQKAETIAKKRGCVGIWLYTATFQAPGFYEKIGFRLFGKLPDYPRGYDNFYYMKRLDA